MIAQKDYSMLNDQQLQQAMMFAQRSNNTADFIGLMAEAEKRKKIRNEQQGMQAGEQLAQGPKTQADAVIAGIADLSVPSDEKGYANGGVVALAGGGTGEDYISDSYQDRLAAYEAARRAELAPQLSLPLEYKSGAESYPSWLKVLGGTPEWFRHGAGRGNVGGTSAEQNKSRSTAPVIGPDAAAAPIPDREGNRNGPVASIDKNREPRLDSSGGGSRTSSAVKSLIKAAAPTAATAAPETTPEWMKAPKERSLADIMADRKTAAAEGEAGIKALMDPYAAKIEERRKKIEGETADSEGLLGLKWGDDKRKALRDFGLAMMAGKDPNWMVNAGAAGKAAAEAYDAAKEKRQARMDALDERDQKLAMARYEMSRGNREEAGRLVKEADDANQTAFKNRFEIGKFGEERKEKAKELDLKERELAQRMQLGLAQIASADRGHQISGRNQQLELYSALGGGDPKKGYEFAKRAGAEGGIDKAVMTQLLKDPELKSSNPALYNYIVTQLYGSGPGAVTSAPTGNLVK